MPTNVTPEYRKAEQAFRLARDPKERLACLKEMLRTFPSTRGRNIYQIPHQGIDGRARRPEEGGKPCRNALRGPARGRRASGPDRAAELRQILAPSAAHGIAYRGGSCVVGWCAATTTSTQVRPKVLFHGFDAKTPLGERWRRLAQTKLRELDELQRGVSRMRSAIKIGLACGCLNIEDCTLARSRNRETGQLRKPSSNGEPTAPSPVAGRRP